MAAVIVSDLIRHVELMGTCDIDGKRNRMTEQVYWRRGPDEMGTI